MNCVGLTEVIVPESVESIGYGAFWGCSDLESLTLTKKLKRFADRAFFECDRLKNIYYIGTLKDTEKLTIVGSENTAITETPWQYIRAPQSPLPLIIIGVSAVVLIAIVVIILIKHRLRQMQGHKVEQPEPEA